MSKPNETLEDHRTERNRIFREGVTSPLTERQKAAFDGLTYYEENPALDFKVRVNPVIARECIIVQTTKNETKEYLRYAEFTFEVEGRELRLTLYKAPFGFFVPFVDANAGVETYGAGRYIDPEQIDDETFHIDFNKAYNPLCAYNDLWNCPITPDENRLEVAIRAGERNPEGAWAKLREPRESDEKETEAE